MDFWQFSRNAYICFIPGKLSENHFHTWLFSNLSHTFKKKKDLSTWIGEQPFMQMDLRQFSRNNTYVSIPGKLSEILLHAWMFSNPYEQVIIIVGLSWNPDLRVQHYTIKFYLNFHPQSLRTISKIKILVQKLWECKVGGCHNCGS